MNNFITQINMFVDPVIMKSKIARRSSDSLEMNLRMPTLASALRQKDFNSARKLSLPSSTTVFPISVDNVASTGKPYQAFEPFQPTEKKDASSRSLLIQQLRKPSMTVSLEIDDQDRNDEEDSRRQFGMKQRSKDKNNER